MSASGSLSVLFNGGKLFFSDGFVWFVETTVLGCDVRLLLPDDVGHFCNTAMFLSFRTDTCRSGQTVPTQLRLLLHFLVFCLHL